MIRQFKPKSASLFDQKMHQVNKQMKFTDSLVHKTVEFQTHLVDIC